MPSKKKKPKVPKTAVTGRLGAEAALAFQRHNGAGPINTDKRDKPRQEQLKEALKEQDSNE